MHQLFTSNYKACQSPPSSNKTVFIEDKFIIWHVNIISCKNIPIYKSFLLRLDIQFGLTPLTDTL
jgi:hypothetical protein